MTAVRYLLGLDIGTTATKCIVLHPERGVIASGEAPATLRSPYATWAEEDPREWWANLSVLIPHCLGKAGVKAREIAGVGVSGAVPCVTALDSKSEVLRPSIQQSDARAVEQIAYFQERLDETEVLRRTGSAVSQQSIGPKLLWLRRHEPEVMGRAACIQGSYDYIVHRLTGCHSCERNWALESGLYDLERGDWDENILSLATIDRGQLGTLRWPADVVGEVTAAAGRETGLAAGTPVVAGTADHIASAFSAGVLKDGDVLIKLGGSGDILYALDRPLVDRRLYLDYHVVPGRYVLNGCMAASGSIIKWFRSQLAGDAEYDALDAEGAAVAPGSGGLVLLPYFLGEKTPINDPEARGVLFGLNLSHTRGHVYRTILEGIAFGLRHHLVVLEERGLSAARARVTNGGARSQLWKQVVADVLGLPLEPLAGHPGSSLGAAFVAGMGAGLFRDWGEIERFVHLMPPVEPDGTAAARYDALFDVYRSLYERNRDLFRSLNVEALRKPL